MDVNFVRLVFTLRLERDVSNPLALFGIKDRFMAAFRGAVSCRCSRCENCPCPNVCAFHQTFSQTLSSDPAAVKRFQKPPYPFVFEFPIVPAPPNSGDTLECSLTLVGSAVNFISDYLTSVRLVFQHDRSDPMIDASLIRVDSVDYSGNCHPILDRSGIALDRLVCLSFAGLQKTNVISPGDISLSIVTPMRIMHEGRALREFSFSPFVRALLRRISSMAYYYGGVEMDLDYKWLADRSNSIESINTDFQWVEWKKGLCGVIGNGTIRGDTMDFLPVILLGELLHVGKGASFGLGRYRIGQK